MFIGSLLDGYGIGRLRNAVKIALPQRADLAELYVQ